MDKNQLKLWPFDEARKLDKRLGYKKTNETTCNFQTGYQKSERILHYHSDLH